MKLSFVIPGKPVGKQRPKFVRRGAYVGTYTPKQTVDYEKYIKDCFKEKYPEWIPTEKPLLMNIKAFFVRPKSNKNIQPITIRLDADNIAKIICDGLNGIAYKDDKQIIGLIVNKLWGEIETVRIEIEEMED